MNRLKKWALAAACAALLASVSIGVTAAYLTSQSTVTNTFTVGNVAITMDESKVNPDGTAIQGAGRVKENACKLLPGHTYLKDPIVHIAAGSEDCWVFVKVENGIADIEAAGNTIASQLTANGWTAVAGAENVYSHAIAKAGDDLAVVGSYSIADDVANAALADYEDETIVVTAYAIQADGFDSAADAWAALKAS